MKLVLLFVLAVVFSTSGHAEIESFSKSKRFLASEVYADRADSEEGTFYCGCSWNWQGSSGGQTDLSSCEYKTRAQPHRAARIEWEHVVSAWTLGHQRQCWQEGGRKHCRTSDPLFGVMEADPHNLVPTIGETNADRSNFNFGMIPGEPRVYGSCDFEVDFKERVVEPRPEVRGQIARIHFYMHDQYGLRMSTQQQQLLMAWDRSYPVTDWELERNNRISRISGRSNPYVTGHKTWSMGYRPQLAINTNVNPAADSRPAVEPEGNLMIRGNRRSRIYHLPAGCPSYSRISPNNVETFVSESAAIDAGYRKAGNCR